MQILEQSGPEEPYLVRSAWKQNGPKPSALES